MPSKSLRLVLMYEAAHMWPHIWGKYDMLDPGSSNLERAIQWSKDYVIGMLIATVPIASILIAESISLQGLKSMLDHSGSQYY